MNGNGARGRSASVFLFISYAAGMTGASCKTCQHVMTKPDRLFRVLDALRRLRSR